MDKQKQIDEMARTLTTCERNSCVGCRRVCIDYRIAKALYNAGYRKIPENEVVLTMEEYDLLNIAKKTWASDGEEVQASTLIDTLKRVRKAERNETAEKFAERLRSGHTVDEYDGEGVNRPYVIADYEELDEICKEITME